MPKSSALQSYRIGIILYLVISISSTHRRANSTASFFPIWTSIGWVSTRPGKPLVPAATDVRWTPSFQSHLCAAAAQLAFSVGIVTSLVPINLPRLSAPLPHDANAALQSLFSRAPPDRRGVACLCLTNKQKEVAKVTRRSLLLMHRHQCR